MFVLNDLLEFVIVYWFKGSLMEIGQEANCKLISN